MNRRIASAAALLILLAATACITWPVYRVFAETGASDFGQVTKTAERMAAEGEIRGTHFLFPVLVIALTRALPSLTFLQATAAGLVGLWTLTAGLVFFAFRERMRTPSVYAIFLLVPLVLVTLFFGPFNLITYPQKQLHAGYFNAFNFHNASSNMLKPFALVLFLAFTRGLSGRRAHWPLIAAIAVVHVVSLLAKPSFSVYFLPAIAVVTAWSKIRGRPIDLRLVIWAYLMPFVAVSGTQFVLTFTPAHVTAAQHYIVWAPFKLLLRTTPGAIILSKIVASILLPLVTVVVFSREARANRELLVAWLGFAIAASYVSLLLEGVPGPEGWFAGNFGWSVQMGTFLLFVATIRHLLTMLTSDVKPMYSAIGFAARLFAVSVAAAANLAGGLMWYWANVTNNAASWR